MTTILSDLPAVIVINDHAYVRATSNLGLKSKQELQQALQVAIHSADALMSRAAGKLYIEYAGVQWIIDIATGELFSALKV